MRTRQFSWRNKPADAGPYWTAVVDLERGGTVQVTESPTGRSVQIHVREGKRDEWRRVYP